MAALRNHGKQKVTISLSRAVLGKARILAAQRETSISGLLAQEIERLVERSCTLWCVDTTPAEIATAFRIEDESRVGFWDALIVASAL